MKTRLPAVLLALSAAALAASENTTAAPSLDEGFRNPPDSAKPWTLWQWMDGNISPEGITADLEAFKRGGIAGVQLFHLDYGLPQGPVTFNSPRWHELLNFAINEAARLGLQFGTHNCGGWSASGGPWVSPENSMQIVVSTETRVTGPSRFDALLPAHKSFLPPPHNTDYRDIAVLAYPTPPGERVTFAAAAPKTAVTPGKGAVQPVPDGDALANFAFPVDNGSPRRLLLEFAQPFSARQLILAPAAKDPGFEGLLECSDDGKTFATVRAVSLFGHPGHQEYPYRQNFNFPTVYARFFRLTVTRSKSPKNNPVRLATFALSPRLSPEDLPGKNLEQRHFFQPKPLPKTPAKNSAADGAVARASILNLTGKMDAATGRLVWDVPAGDWTLLRVGHQSNGMKNHPPPTGGEGLESDKFSREATDAHWAAFMGKIIALAGPLAGKTLTKVETDSWEVGSQNWTPKFPSEFAKRGGYDLTPFLPVFAGQTVDSPETTERFLWDFRRVAADLFADNYASRMSQLARASGLEFSAENYGNGPFDDLQYGGRVDMPMGVFWMQNGSPMCCTLIAASSAHTYGKKIVAAEAFTAGEAGGNRWDTDPFALKRIGDLILCSGLNRFIFHAATLQRFPGVLPGLTFGKVGSQFSTTQTWFHNGGDQWRACLARCQWLLQHGLPAADVLALAAENAPPATYGGSAFPDVPAGYDFDLCSTEALLTRASVRDGNIVLPDGATYRLLLLPKETAMTPRVLEKLRRLAADGATIVGPKPTRAPGLQDDDAVRQAAAKLWQPSPRPGAITHRSAADALAALNLPPDFETLGPKHQVAWKHRSAPDAEIYFVSNQKYFPDAFDAAFRVTGKTPELWNPETGEIRDAPVWREENGRTIVPLRLENSGSVFVVFRRPAGNTHLTAFLPENTPTPDNPPPLEILRATYGRFDQASRPGETDLTRTKAANYKRIMTPERFTNRDPAPGREKHMLVLYTSNNTTRSQAAPADSVLELPQLPATFKTLRVLYGSLSAAPAANDSAVDVTETLRARLRDGSLSVDVSNALLPSGDKPPPPPRELRVEYRHNGRWNIALMPEGNRLDLPSADEYSPPDPGWELIRDEKTSAPPLLLARRPGVFAFASANGQKFAASVASVPAPSEINGPWRLSFPPNLGAPGAVTLDRLISWPDHPDEGVKYFSGTAAYETDFTVTPEQAAAGNRLILDLGAVKNIAQVIVNGRTLATLWKPPFATDITRAVKPGPNRLEVRVTNLWPNRLIGDERKKPDREWTSTRNLVAFPKWLLEGKKSPTGQVTFTTGRHWFADSPLLPSGLLGPVRLLPAKTAPLLPLK
jgi:hypothetical protein